jgi:hypothetical protein
MTVGINVHEVTSLRLTGIQLKKVQSTNVVFYTRELIIESDEGRTSITVFANERDGLKISR